MTTGKSKRSNVLKDSSVRDIIKHRPAVPTGSSAMNHMQHAPQGYTLVAFGTPELSKLCKEISANKSLSVQIAKEPTGHRRRNTVAEQMDRVGYYFSTEVVEEACSKLGYSYIDGAFKPMADLRTGNMVGRTAEKLGITAKIQLNDENPAKLAEIVKEMFPLIPEPDLNNVVYHAFKEGSERVGTLKEIPLWKRIQLAVGAHIRHEHTDYDFLLKAFDYHVARAEVTAVIVLKILEWRGETEADAGLQQYAKDAFGTSAPEDNTDTSDPESSGNRTVPQRRRSGHSSSRKHEKRQIREVERFSTAREASPHVVSPAPAFPAQRSVVRTEVALDARGLAPNEIIINGQRMIRRNHVQQPYPRQQSGHSGWVDTRPREAYSSNYLPPPPQPYQQPSQQPVRQHGDISSLQPAPYHYRPGSGSYYSWG